MSAEPVPRKMSVTETEKSAVPIEVVSSDATATGAAAGADDDDPTVR